MENFSSSYPCWHDPTRIQVRNTGQVRKLTLGYGSPYKLKILVRERRSRRESVFKADWDGRSSGCLLRCMWIVIHILSPLNGRRWQAVKFIDLLLCLHVTARVWDSQPVTSPATHKCSWFGLCVGPKLIITVICGLGTWGWKLLLGAHI